MSRNYINWQAIFVIVPSQFFVLVRCPRSPISFSRLASVGFSLLQFSRVDGDVHQQFDRSPNLFERDPLRC